MDKAIDLIKEIFHERINNTFTKSFCISWILWNYKFIMILLSDNSVSTTILLINRFAFPNFILSLVYGILLPLISSLLYIYLSPIITKYINSYILKKNIEIKDALNEVSKLDRLTPEQSQNLIISHAQERARLKSVLSEKNIEIESLNQQISILSQTAKPTPTPTPTPKNKPIQKVEIIKNKTFENDANNFLLLIADNIDHNNHIKSSFLNKISPDIEETKRKSFLAYLENEGLIEFSYHQDDGSAGYTVTDEGLIEAGRSFYPNA